MKNKKIAKKTLANSVSIVEGAKGKIINIIRKTEEEGDKIEIVL